MRRRGDMLIYKYRSVTRMKQGFQLYAACLEEAA